MKNVEILQAINAVSNRVNDMNKKLDSYISLRNRQAEIEISDLMLDNMEAQQTISDLELDIIELKE